MQRANIIIIGAGVVGAATAHYLARSAAFAPGEILMIERDPAFTRGSTGRSAGGIRQQFSTPENIAMSQATLAVIRDLAGEFGAELANQNDPGFREQGYLMLATPAGHAILAANHATQIAAGADIELLAAAGLAQRFPWLDTSDLSAGAFGRSGEGWIDGASLAQLLRKSAARLGVRTIHAEVCGLPHGADRRIAGATLADGRTIAADTIVNAAGPWAGDIARLAGIDLPVEPRKRFVYVLDLRDPPPALALAPLAVDPSGVWFRPEGRHFICGRSPAPDQEPADRDLDRIDHAFFETEVWPQLAARVPAFEKAKVVNAWAGFYDYNTLDQNAVIGAHPDVGNFYCANGFSGHGLQQATAAGRAIAELILHGRFVTLDLSRFGFARIATHSPLVERNVI